PDGGTRGSGFGGPPPGSRSGGRSGAGPMSGRSNRTTQVASPPATAAASIGPQASSSAVPCGVTSSASATLAQATAPTAASVSPAAASSANGHSRYHGWTTGPSTTIPSSASPSARTGDRPPAVRA